ncbi:MAG: 3-deoxy-manno-octulosonate cytidylyltransferase [Deltaproteobacteria bacterium]|nr:MAG: 3-deoxy-manno-octulosonate cytidylyltransferase [Deltaproteobacteria bacterium]
MRAVGVIPARYRASRFPGKPLALISGMPMIQRVWLGARSAKSLARVIVATDDARIADACHGFGAEVVLTREDHPSGTDRIAEVAERIDCDVVVNVQGDEPLIEGFAIDAVVTALDEDPEAPMATLVHAAELEALADPNRVKVVLDRRGRALYFSRSAIPFQRTRESAPRCWQHVGLYAYRREFLLRFPTLAPTPAERAEELEQLRALEHGYPIRCAVIDGWTSAAVDVPSDIAQVEARLAGRG